MTHRWVQMHRPWVQALRQWVQDGQIGVGQELTDTTVLQLPVDCVLAGQQELYTDRGRTWELYPMRLRSKPAVARGTALRKLTEGTPSFTVTSSRRGYD